MLLAKINIGLHNLRQKTKVIFLQDKIVIILFLVGLLLNLALYLAINLGIKPATEPIILHYSVYFGIDFIGHWQQLYLMPAVGTFLWLVNFILALFFYQQEKITSYLLSGVILLIELFLLIGGGLLIWINY